LKCQQFKLTESEYWTYHQVEIISDRGVGWLAPQWFWFTQAVEGITMENIGYQVHDAVGFF
jgi:hypothetical protein